MKEWKKIFRQEGFVQVDENKFHNDINDETIVFNNGLVFMLHKGKNAPIKQSLLQVCLDFIEDNPFVKKERELIGLLLKNDIFTVIDRFEVDKVYRTEQIKKVFKSEIMSAISLTDKDQVIIMDSKGRAHSFNTKEFKGGDELDFNERFKKFIGPTTFVGKITEEDYKKDYLIVVTKKNKVKKTLLSDFNQFKSSVLVIDLKDDDRIVYAATCDDQDEMILISDNNKALRFSTSEFQPVDKQARGYKAFDNQVDIVGAALVSSEDFVLTSTELKGKISKVSKFPFGGRSTNGRTIAENTIFIQRKQDEFIIISSDNGIATMLAEDIPIKEYKSSGVKMIEGSIRGIFC